MSSQSTKKSYLETTRDVYREAALMPDVGLCCTSSPVWQLPQLDIPKIMLEMNYGCGSTVHPRDLIKQPKILYVGVGGGMELLQFAYFSRQPGGVIGLDVVDAMIEASDKNLRAAAETNDWFERDFIDLRFGDALSLPVADNSIDVAAQNCLFNIFEEAHLQQALAEMYRVLRPHGRLILSDPICNQTMPATLKNDQRLRAQCLSGAIPLNDYLQRLIDAGFGTIEVRARRPYRVLSPHHYDTEERIFIESVEICAIKDPMPADGACVFTGRNAIYFGKNELFNDGKGHIMSINQPLPVCDKTAAALDALGRDDILITSPTWFYDGGGCC